MQDSLVAGHGCSDSPRVLPRIPEVAVEGSRFPASPPFHRFGVLEGMVESRGTPDTQRVRSESCWWQAVRHCGAFQDCLNLLPGDGRPVHPAAERRSWFIPETLAEVLLEKLPRPDDAHV